MHFLCFDEILSVFRKLQAGAYSFVWDYPMHKKLVSHSVFQHMGLLLSDAY